MCVVLSELEPPLWLCSLPLEWQGLGRPRRDVFDVGQFHFSPGLALQLIYITCVLHDRTCAGEKTECEGEVPTRNSFLAYFFFSPKGDCHCPRGK